MSRKLSDELAKIPKVTGGGADSGQVYATQRLGRVLARAEQEAGKLKDEYVSVEHVLIAMLDEPGAASKILREAGLTHDKLMAVLQKVRGNQRVTSSNPEATYQALEKIRPRPDQARRGRQDRSGHRTRRGNPPRDPGALAPHQEQPGADRRAGRRQDRDRRGTGAAHRQRRRARGAQGQASWSRSTWAR